MKILQSSLVAAAAMLIWTHAVLAQGTRFSNQGGITNTRHNLTQRPALGASAVMMDSYRNDYGEVCVYCHTPHAANASIAAPLWNRAIKTTNYTTYDTLNTSTLTQEVYQPGAASLMCLSCHDGQQAVDAIMNMPGSGRYSASPDEAFLSSWSNPSGLSGGHMDMNPSTSMTGTSCLICHSPAVSGNIFSGKADFQFAAIGTDLRNEHPIGVRFPATTGVGTDWKTPNASVSKGGGTAATFFDENGNGRLDKNEIRMYDTGSGPVVECASCHDPHGVPSGAAGTPFNPTFLRKTITNSVVCQTCHTK